jgi:hypothetical protein
MINGHIGWLLSTEGKVLFTNDGFANIRQETFVDQTGNAVSIEKLILSSDLQTAYGVTKNTAGSYMLFRY